MKREYIMKISKIISLSLLSLTLSGCALVCKTQTLQKKDNQTIVNTQYTLFGLSSQKITSPGFPGMLVPVYASETILIDSTENEPTKALSAELKEAK
jgi:hypothetical protein